MNSSGDMRQKCIIMSVHVMCPCVCTQLGFNIHTKLQHLQFCLFSALIAGKYKTIISATKTAKRLRMRQVEHFRSLFQSHLPVRSKSPARVRIHSVCSLWFSSSASCCSCFDYFVVIEIAFMDNQAQITETISRLDSEKVR